MPRIPQYLQWRFSIHIVWLLVVSGSEITCLLEILVRSRTWINL